MIWALILCFLVMMGLLAWRGTHDAPWGRKLRRLHAGVARQAEWMAPDDVVEQVRHDYLHMVEWLETAPFLDHPRHRAPEYLTGEYLRRYQRLNAIPIRFTGVLIAKHTILVRHFSDDGMQCLVIDCQTQRQILTYDERDSVLLNSQLLDDGTLVCSMVYDSLLRRWKLAAMIQELPAGWQDTPRSNRVRLLSTLPTTMGRDD
ncbi:MAG: hypothetical protein ABI690_17055 [Chloroflexota bacterium]